MPVGFEWEEVFQCARKVGDVGFLLEVCEVGSDGEREPCRTQRRGNAAQWVCEEASRLGARMKNTSQLILLLFLSLLAFISVYYLFEQSRYHPLIDCRRETVPSEPKIYGGWG
ncbi:hypothetical protein BDV30DRAFT_213844 [Aspergillus minisclerotigenes]|uniref:Uncharacterized protein n=1 Tax=Aspergillus minisclerotigenes TaxID=656917 RepID=A0A5N6IXK4_9EURO|nr:hypothetical protein BDV30DRAFT_213844 [Aspergillus minisclerotigenes]